jgi:hypothetical protein
MLVFKQVKLKKGKLTGHPVDLALGQELHEPRLKKNIKVQRAFSVIAHFRNKENYQHCRSPYTQGD